MNAKTASDLRSYGVAVVSNGHESRTGHVVNCTAQVELHQIYFNIKPESPGNARLRAPFGLFYRLEKSRHVKVLSCSGGFSGVGGGTSSRWLSTPPILSISFCLSNASILSLSALVHNIIHWTRLFNYSVSALLQTLYYVFYLSINVWF